MSNDNEPRISCEAQSPGHTTCVRKAGHKKKKHKDVNGNKWDVTPVQGVVDEQPTAAERMGINP